MPRWRQDASSGSQDFSTINVVKPVIGTIGIAALLLQAAKTDGINVITGPKAFTNTASLSPGLARKITAQDLPQPQHPGLGGMFGMISAGFRGGKRPENAIPKDPPGFKIDLYIASGL